MRRSAVLALTLAAAAPLAAQQPVTVTFSEYASRSTNENIPAAVGDPLRSGGFDFYQTDAYYQGARNALGTWGTDPRDPGFTNLPVNRGGSTALGALVPGTAGTVDMFVAGDNPLDPTREFNIYSIDIAHLYSTEFVPTLQPIPLTFFGSYANGAVIQQMFTVGVPAADPNGVRRPTLQRLTFDGRWHSLENVWWSQGTALSTLHQFTNVTAAVVPEPGTYVLLATGLAGLGLVARRRRGSRAG